MVIGDETWAYHRDPETNMESKHRSTPTPKKCKIEKSAGKVMVFWDREDTFIVGVHAT